MEQVHKWLINRKSSALLIDGRPGTGKSSSVYKCAEKLNYKVIEFNSTNTKSRKFFHEELTKCLKYRNVQMFFEKNPKTKLILIDEIDTIIKQDKGIMLEIIDWIKRANDERLPAPMIFISDEMMTKKLESLKIKCDYVHFERPVSDRLLTICKERLKKKGLRFVNDKKCMILIEEYSQGDIRRCMFLMDELEAICLFKKKKIITETFIKSVMAVWKEKDVKNSTSDNVTNLFNSESKTILDFDVEIFNTSLMYMLHENYLNTLGDKQIDEMVSLSDMFSETDCVDKVISSDQEWSLLEPMNTRLIMGLLNVERQKYIFECNNSSVFSKNNAVRMKRKQLHSKRLLNRNIEDIGYVYRILESKTDKELVECLLTYEDDIDTYEIIRKILKKKPKTKAHLTKLKKEYAKQVEQKQKSVNIFK